MSNISKCSGKNCKLKETCLRFTIKATEFQWYVEPSKGKECELYIKIEEDERKIHI